MSEILSILERIKEGNYGLDDINELFVQIAAHKDGFRICSWIKKTFLDSRKACERLFELSIIAPETLVSMLKRYPSRLELLSIPFYNAYVVASLMADNFDIELVYKAIDILDEDYPLFILYNPLILLYVTKINALYLQKEVAGKIERNMPLIEANPVNEKSLLVRDLFIFLGLVKNPELTKDLYTKFDFEKVYEVFMEQEIVVDYTLYRNAYKSFIRVLESLLSTIRSSIRGLILCDMICIKASKFMEEHGEEVSWYSKVSCSLLKYSVNHSLDLTGKFLGDEIGGGPEFLSNILQEFVADPMIFTNSIYETLSLLVEASATHKFLDDLYELEPSPRIIKRYHDLVKNIDVLIESLILVAKNYEDEIISYLDGDDILAALIRDKIEQFSDIPFLAWLGNRLGS